MLNNKLSNISKVSNIIIILILVLSSIFVYDYNVAFAENNGDAQIAKDEAQLIFEQLKADKNVESSGIKTLSSYLIKGKLMVVKCEMIGGYGQIAAKIWAEGSDIPGVNLTFSLERKKSYGNYYVPKGKDSRRKNVKFKTGVLHAQYLNASTKIDGKEKTRRWRLHAKGTVAYKKIDEKTASKLCNKKGDIYPTFYGPGVRKSNNKSKKLKVPKTSLKKISKSERCDRKQIRAPYIKWYKNNYKKISSVHWSFYEIHHMQPLEYGGDNGYKNLIPLTEGQHNRVHRWWDNY